jgi:hypothetical protein
MFTADNGLGQANPTDVRSGVSYASGNLTGRLTVPARGSVSLNVNYGPSMPFTATRSGTTATATLAYSYPLVVGDQFTVTGASNNEWNSTYTIASVVSGTSVTFAVPNTHSASAGTGALMQTTGTAVLDPGAVASAVWGAATRTITGGTVDTLTNAPTVPSAAAIASQVRTELGTELGRLDQSISSRLASADYTTPPTTAQISAAVEGSLLDENDGQAVLNAIVGAIGNTNLSEVSLVAAVRADLERTGGKIDSIPTTAAPTAAQNATAVWGTATKEITGGTVTTLTNAPASVTPSDIWSYNARTLTSASGPTATEIRQEMDNNSTKLANLDAAVSSRFAASSYTAPSTPPTASAIADEVRVELATELAKLDAPVSGATAPSASTVASAIRTELATELGRMDVSVSSRLAASESTKLDAVKAKTDALNTERLANVATTAIVGNLIAQANS